MKYKENARGWWISQLKDPLRSESISYLRKQKRDMESMCPSMFEALFYPPKDIDSYYWQGVKDYLTGAFCLTSPFENPETTQGWMIAKECVPKIAQEIIKPFQWTDDNVMDFVNWFLKVKNIDQRYEIENIEIINSFKNGDQPEIWK